MAERIETVVVGGGQAGLATGMYLAQRGAEFTILERHERVGESWRRRWDGLRLFTPARLDGLPGMPFPGPPDRLPTKDEVADYLEAYAARMRLPVRTGIDVTRMGRGERTRFAVRTDHGLIEADHVVAASGGWHTPAVPPFADGLSADIVQLHSSAFRSTAQLQPGPVLVVGAANSGAEIAVMAARGHETWLAGRDTGQMPFDIEGRVAHVADHVIWFLANHVLTVNNPIGRRARSMRDHGTPLERVRKGDLAAAGVHRITARVEGTREGRPLLANGQVVDVSNVIWATGFRHDYAWIDLDRPVIGEDGWPLHERGVSTVAEGLYFVGLPFQHSLASALLGGVGRDARFVADRLSADARAALSVAGPRAERPRMTAQD
jgi:putative flavoprotein involved in K+ transport